MLLILAHRPASGAAALPQVLLPNTQRELHPTKSCVLMGSSRTWRPFSVLLLRVPYWGTEKKHPKSKNHPRETFVVPVWKAVPKRRFQVTVLQMGPLGTHRHHPKPSTLKPYSAPPFLKPRFPSPMLSKLNPKP